MRKSTAWFLIVVMAVMVIIAIDYFFDVGLVANLLRFAFRGLVSLWRLLLAGMYMLADMLWQVLIRGIGWGRLTRPFTAVAMGVGVGYLLTNDRLYSNARDFKHKSQAMVVSGKSLWNRQNFWVKVAITVAMIVAQVGLHFYLILFPVGFLIAPLVKILRNWAANEAFGAWYWRHLRTWHAKVARKLQSMLGIGHMISLSRLARLYFRGGWRAWRYVFAGYGQVIGRVHLIRHYERWGKYRGRPLLAGVQSWPEYIEPKDYWNEREQGAHPIAAFIAVLVIVFLVMEFFTEWGLWNEFHMHWQG